MKSVLKRALSGTLAVCMTTGICMAADTTSSTAEQETKIEIKAVEMPENGTITKISFDQLAPTMEAYSPSILSLKESKASLNAFNRGLAYDSLIDAYNSLTSISYMMSTSSEDSVSGYLSSTTFGSMIDSQQASLKTQIEALEEDEYQKTYDKSLRQIESGMNQLIMAGQSLYLNIISMEQQLDTSNQNIEALKRSITSTEKMYELGVASFLTLENIKSQLTTAESGVASLEYQIKVSKQMMQKMLGSNTSGQLTLGEVPEVTQDQLQEIQYDEDLKSAMQNNATICSDNNAISDAKDDLEDSPGGYKYEMAQHDYQQAVETYNSDVASFKSSFQDAYQALTEKQRLIKTEEDELSMEKRNLDVSEYKYKLGLISYQSYLNQKDTYNTADEDVTSAKLALYQAYNTYSWAVQGIVS